MSTTEYQCVCNTIEVVCESIHLGHSKNASKGALAVWGWVEAMTAANPCPVGVWTTSTATPAFQHLVTKYVLHLPQGVGLRLHSLSAAPKGVWGRYLE
jgi:hypothetical protein